jgi:hypothetical protein
MEGDDLYCNENFNDIMNAIDNPASPISETDLSPLLHSLSSSSSSSSFDDFSDEFSNGRIIFTDEIPSFVLRPSPILLSITSATTIATTTTAATITTEDTASPSLSINQDVERVTIDSVNHQQPQEQTVTALQLQQKMTLSTTESPMDNVTSITVESYHTKKASQIFPPFPDYIATIAYEESEFDYVPYHDILQFRKEYDTNSLNYLMRILFKRHSDPKMFLLRKPHDDTMPRLRKYLNKYCHAIKIEKAVKEEYGRYPCWTKESSLRMMIDKRFYGFDFSKYINIIGCDIFSLNSMRKRVWEESINQSLINSNMIFDSYKQSKDVKEKRKQQYKKRKSIDFRLAHVHNKRRKQLK